MNKMLILLFAFIFSISTFSVKIVNINNEIIDCEFISMSRTQNEVQIFYKINNKVSRISINDIKLIEFSPEEKDNMYFSLKNGYSFKAEFERIDGDYIILKNKETLFRINKNDLNIITLKNRVISEVINTEFGKFHINPLEIVSDIYWKVKTKYGILLISSQKILSSFMPDITSENKNLVYLNNGDYFFYNSVLIEDSKFKFEVLNYIIETGKEDILFLKDKSYLPNKNRFTKKFKLNINNNEYFVDDFEIYGNKIIFDDVEITNPDINFISKSIVNIYILNDIFFGGVTSKDNNLYVSGYSKKLYSIDMTRGINKVYNISSYSHDFPVLYDNKIFLSGYRKSLIEVNLTNDKIYEKEMKDTFSSISIINENYKVIHLYSKYLHFLDKNNNIVKSFEIKTSKVSPLIDYDGNIITLDISGNLYKFDNNLNLLFKLSLNDKTESFSIDKNNNIYISGPDKKFTVLNKNGDILYQYELPDIPYSYPLIDEKNNEVYISLFDGYLYSLKNGEINKLLKVGLVPGAGVLTENYIILNNLKYEIILIDKKSKNIVEKCHLGYSNKLSIENGFLYAASSKGVISIIDINDKETYQYKFNSQHTGNPNIEK
ncbi:PQQ-like beta-propeller repeat protein [Marinitoga litoralis]|jgi:hypothetical protein|uniref:PQQ-like beta-propeller repeat protein n=1 Tax=Marinitoga litoralis TaxID=570855 RepID=UPI00195FD717|nr:PQQ-like beta-propeller repeat protein [Marinitoga litoralis]MBM7558915.1 hypothetical protein [Marinitoga litoralis]